jgi:APA family basic amino acid/polyamine antiporter
VVTQLTRRLGLGDAIVIGLAAMIGAGVFSAFAPAAHAAGSGLLIGLAIAALIAFCNATASAQLAAQYPTSGGTYVYGRERLGHWWGFAAGWGFVVGKTASCAAMALTFATYAVPGPDWSRRLVAIAVVLALTALNYRGITRTAALGRLLLCCTLAVLAIVVIAIWVGGNATTSNITDVGDPRGWLQAAGLLFFAFAGYARVATLGEEVRDPARTIPRAISIALLVAVLVYAVVGFSALAAGGPDVLASTTAPLAEAVKAAGSPAIAPVVRVGAAIASAGALLALIAGIGRTAFAMARERDLPGYLDAVHPRYGVPHRAEIALSIAVCVLVATTDLRNAIGFSSFGVLVYYAIANLSAFTQDPGHRRAPKWLQVLGVVGCVVLVASLPLPAIIAGIAVFAVGLGGRLLLRRTRTQ